jgi:multiple sugar transport system ATP-binding protein
MNLFDVVVEADGDDLRLHATEGFTIPVPPEKRDYVGPYKRKKVIMGIRPENIHDKEFQPPNIRSAVCGCEVDVTEMMGNEVNLYLEVDEHKFLGRVDPRTAARPGQEIQVAFDIDRIHLFDPTTTQAIGTNAAESRDDSQVPRT